MDARRREYDTGMTRELVLFMENEIDRPHVRLLSRVDSADRFITVNTIMPILTFKVSEAEALRIRREARRRKAPVSVYIRQRLLSDEAEQAARPLVKKHPVSGLPYDANPRAVRATEEEIQAALADYP